MELEPKRIQEKQDKKDNIKGGTKHQPFPLLNYFTSSCSFPAGCVWYVHEYFIIVYQYYENEYMTILKASKYEFNHEISISFIYVD